MPCSSFLINFSAYRATLLQVNFIGKVIQLLIEHKCAIFEIIISFVIILFEHSVMNIDLEVKSIILSILILERIHLI